VRPSTTTSWGLLAMEGARVSRMRPRWLSDYSWIASQTLKEALDRGSRCLT
jgi:hypothetical protein